MYLKNIFKTKEDKFKFIEENKGIYDIKRLCKALKISRSEYYYHKRHRTNAYKEDNRKLDVDILRIYNESKKRYGSPKIHQMLEKEGKYVSKKRVGKRMRFLKIKSCIVKKYKPAREYFYRADMNSSFGKALYLNNSGISLW